MTATVPGVLLTGDTASKPLATAVSIGTLYSDTDTGAVTQSDGAAWQPWAGPFVTGGTADWAETGDLVAVAIDGAADGGALTEFARGDHEHAGPTTADVRATVDWAEDGDITTAAFGDAAAANAGTETAPAGHRHGMPANPVTGGAVMAVLDFGESGDIGASAPGDAAAAGATGEVADAGHKHPRLTERVVYEYVIDGGGSVITTGLKGGLYVPDAFTLTGWAIGLDLSGSIVIDVWNDARANYPPTVADSLNAGGGTKPTVTTTTNNRDVTLTSYDTSIQADSYLFFNVDSISTATRAVIALWGYRV